MRWSIGSVLLLLAVLAAAAWLAWSTRDQLRAMVESTPEQPADVKAAAAEEAPPEAVAALGRIRPGVGVVRVSGPARFAVVVASLEVEVGDWVEAGEVIARLDTVASQKAEVAALEAELELDEIELARVRQVVAGGITAKADLDRARATERMTAARLEQAKAELNLSTVTAPQAGRILEVHTRAGERVGNDGIVELADTRLMFAVAEVYESDVGRLRRGQPARVTSPALPTGGLTGVVERIAPKVSRKDVLDSDPVADADSRVVEVDIKLDEPRAVASLTNLRVEVVIQTGVSDP